MLEILLKNNITNVFGVPDSSLNFLTENFNVESKIKHQIAPNEGSAVALAAGSYLATKTIPLVYMQNSGLFNAGNPITSLTSKYVYDIPILYFIGKRGDTLEKSDEPQHKLTGKITLNILEQMELKFEVVNDLTVLKNKIEKAVEYIKTTSKPIAVVFEKNLKNINNRPHKDGFSTKSVVDMTCNIFKNSYIFTTTGYTSRVALDHTKSSKIFMNVGSMGHTISVAAGFANSSREHTVCIDGDGAALMHTGSWAISSKIDNFVHILINNGKHESVGGQPVSSSLIEYCSIAKGFGYKNTYTVGNAKELQTLLKKIKNQKSVFIQVNTDGDLKASTMKRPELGLINYRDFFTKEITG